MREYFNSRQLVTAGAILTIIICISCCLDTPPDDITAAEAPEIDLDVTWQIPMESPWQGLNSLFVDNKMYFPNTPSQSVDTINLNAHSVENSVEGIRVGSNPTIINDKIYLAIYPDVEISPVIYIFDLDGSLDGRINLDETYWGCSFIISSHSHYLYWDIRYNGGSGFVRLDTETITNTSGDNYTADVQVLYPPEKGYGCGANPTFYDGKVYLPVDKLNYDDVTRILIFDEESGTLEQELDLSEFVGACYEVEVFLSGNTGLVGDKKVNIKTGEVISNLIRVSTHFAPYTFIDNYGYASSDAHGGEDFTSLWKLNMNTLEVEWYYQHEYSCGTQPQVVNGIVYVTAPDMILLFDANTGKILAKDTDLKGHPIQQANSYLYNGEMIFHDGYNITAIKTNWKINSSGGVEKVE